MSGDRDDNGARGSGPEPGPDGEGKDTKSDPGVQDDSTAIETPDAAEAPPDDAPKLAETETLPVLPLRKGVLFPFMLMPLLVGREQSARAVEAGLKREDKVLFVVAQREADADTPSAEDLYQMGTRAVIKRMERTDDGFRLLVQGIDRAELERVTSTTPYLEGEVVARPLPEDDSLEVEALQRAVIDQVGKLQQLSQPQIALGLQQLINQVDDPRQLAFMLTSVLNTDVPEEQRVLEANSQAEILRLISEHLTKEIQVLGLQSEIEGRTKSEMSKRQRDFYLREQLKEIQKELGEDGGEAESDLGELRQQLEDAELPENVREDVDREFKRLERVNPASPEYQVGRSYLELVAELPWHKFTEDDLDLVHAQRILDEDHYGLEKVKERIIEHLAVMKLNPEAKSPILCFVGPPGTGKTSLGQSIARAIGRRFERMAVGGLHDEAELRGHRRTYIGAMPGRVIQAIRRAGVSNPIIMLDEIDKMGRDFRGDPSAALMEILDPSQNDKFRDNYLNLPFDLSKVFFICTANILDTVPGPLLDRMEMLSLDGYTEVEKIQIAKRYLVPRRLKEAGISEERLDITDEALSTMIRGYTREAGLRQLERAIGSVARKVAVRFATGEADAVRVTPEDVVEILGPEKFRIGEARRDMQPGVAAGLAWTPAGGDVLYVEALLLPQKGGLSLTGQLGEVMQESAKAAASWIESQADALGIPAEKFTESSVHVHVPQGAIPKDGPSAGVTMATALASVYTEHPVRNDLAMTGEITLTGLVLPIGGVKQKVLAAHRAGMKHVILPRENEPDLVDVPESVRDDVEFILVERVEEVLAAAIPQLAERLTAGTT